VITIAASYRYTAAKKEAKLTGNTILERAAAAQALLETAVPRVIARELLAGTPAHELTRSVSSASVAFVYLTVADEPDDPMVRAFRAYDLARVLAGLYLLEFGVFTPY
jgi:hypothetical protein